MPPVPVPVPPVPVPVPPVPVPEVPPVWEPPVPVPGEPPVPEVPLLLLQASEAAPRPTRLTNANFLKSVMCNSPIVKKEGGGAGNPTPFGWAKLCRPRKMTSPTCGFLQIRPGNHHFDGPVLAGPLTLVNRRLATPGHPTILFR